MREEETDGRYVLLTPAVKGHREGNADDKETPAALQNISQLGFSFQPGPPFGIARGVGDATLLLCTALTASPSRALSTL